MDRIDAFTVFVRVFETRSFSAVAREMNVTQPTISRLIATLETALRIQLFSRSTRKISPTTDATRIYGPVRELLASVSRIEADVGGHFAEPSGLLRVAVPSSFANARIVSQLGKYLERFPRVSLDLRLSDQVVDLVGEGSELAIWMGELASSSLIARRIGLIERQVVASSKYLRSASAPNLPEDLVDHSCLVYTGVQDATRWTFESDLGLRVVNVTGRLSLDNYDVLTKAVLAGYGIAVLPTWLLRKEIAADEVTVLLPDFQSTALPVSAVYSKIGGLSHRARSFLDFVAECCQSTGQS